MQTVITLSIVVVLQCYVAEGAVKSLWAAGKTFIAAQLGWNQQEEEIQKIELAWNSSHEGREKVLLVQTLLPKVLVVLILEYVGREGEEVTPIAYYNPIDGSYQKRNGNGVVKKLRHIDFQVFGMTSNFLPLVQNCRFNIGLSGRYATVGNGMAKSGTELLHNNTRLAFANLSSFSQNPDRVLPLMTRDTVHVVAHLLGECRMEVRSTSDWAITQGQRNSLLCLIPDMGPREFAQSLKNVVLYLKKQRELLPQQQLQEVDEVSGSALDRAVDMYPQHKAKLEKIINDTTGSLSLVFFNKNFTLEECINRAFEAE